jgi:hypothetical protein
MSYRIAVCSSDGIQVDCSFGAAEEFLIYEVSNDTNYFLERRQVHKANITRRDEEAGAQDACAANQCGGCGGKPRCHGQIHEERTGLIADCRCLLCEKVGMHAARSLEQRAISVFCITTSIEAAFKKLIPYYERVDHHQSLRKA